MNLLHNLGFAAHTPGLSPQLAFNGRADLMLCICRTNLSKPPKLCAGLKHCKQHRGRLPCRDRGDTQIFLREGSLPCNLNYQHWTCSYEHGRNRVGSVAQAGCPSPGVPTNNLSNLNAARSSSFLLLASRACVYVHACVHLCFAEWLRQPGPPAPCPVSTRTMSYLLHCPLPLCCCELFSSWDGKLT